MNIREYLEKKASSRRTPGNFTPSTGRQRSYNYDYRAPSTGQQAMPRRASGSMELDLKRSQQAFDRKLEAMDRKNLALKAKNAPAVPKPKPSIAKKIGSFFRKLV